MHFNSNEMIRFLAYNGIVTGIIVFLILQVG